MFDLPTYMTAVQTVDLAALGPFLVAVVIGSGALIAFHNYGVEKGRAEGYTEGLDDGIGAADSRGAYLDGFNDGLDTASFDCAYPADLISGRAKREE